jgi:hypothetical protein
MKSNGKPLDWSLARKDEKQVNLIKSLKMYRNRSVNIKHTSHWHFVR